MQSENKWDSIRMKSNNNINVLDPNQIAQITDFPDYAVKEHKTKVKAKSHIHEIKSLNE